MGWAAQKVSPPDAEHAPHLLRTELRITGAHPFVVCIEDASFVVCMQFALRAVVQCVPCRQRLRSVSRVVSARSAQCATCTVHGGAARSSCAETPSVDRTT